MLWAPKDLLFHDLWFIVEFGSGDLQAPDLFYGGQQTRRWLVKQ